MTDKPEQHNQNKLFFSFVYLTLVAYLARIAEIFVGLAVLRINLLLFVVTLLLFFISGAATKYIQIKGNKELLLMLAFVFAGFLSVPLSVWPSAALKTCIDSLVLNLAIFLFCQASMITEKRFFSVINAILVSCGILIFGLNYNPVVVEGFRLSTTISYDSNDLALLFAFAFPITASSFVVSKLKGKLFAGCILVGLAIGIVKTGSRGGMLAFGITIIMLSFSSTSGLKLIHKVAVVLMIIVFVLSPKGDGLRERFAKLTSGEDYNVSTPDSTSGGRLAIWKSGLGFLISNPIVGVGVGNSTTAMGEKYGNTSWRTMHNSYLQVAVEAGLIGFIIYITILATILKNCLQSIISLSQTTCKQGKYLLSIACSMKIGLVAYMIAGFFLSQAYSPIVPLALALSSQLKNLSKSYLQTSDIKSLTEPITLS